MLPAARTVRVISFLAASLLLAAEPPPPGPRREPVLKQILLPHRYYYREMYLPQATSGPSAVAWSPDGRELAVSMQGSLWRVNPESGEARQITDGPGYDDQPDWSPDGRFIVYTSYQGDAVELWLLETAGGQARPLTRTGAVNVEPRFAPDGKRLAFVSTAYEGRFHLFTLDLREGQAAGAPERISEDRDSGLPRYYYSRYDHYLSPTWSSDSRELIYLSNHGRIWGSGGFWRMRAERGSPEREIRYEETSWNARPDWSPDGKRVVYSSYLGRPWHQLWLMTAEGGDPFPLTYGDSDAVRPRWSPDATRIAYVSNEGGNLGLFTIDLPGGRRQPVEIRTRRYLNPTGHLVLIVRGKDGQESAARLSVTGPDGRSYAPDEALRHADDAFDRRERPIEYGYFHSPGRCELVVPAGQRLTVEVTRGLEHRVERRELSVPAGVTETLVFSLSRIDDLPSRGWHSADMHVHRNYGGHYRVDSGRLALQAAAEDVHFVFNLIVNKEQRLPDLLAFHPGPDPASTAENLILHSQEYHTSYWGHLGLLGLRDHILLPPYAAYANTAAASFSPDNATIIDLARGQGAISGYVHPFDAEPEPDRGTVFTPLAPAGFRAGEPLALPVDVALGRVDYYEVVGFSDHRASAAVWARLLNCGFRLPAGAGTDAMTNYASLRGPLGLNRAYAKIEGPPDEAHFLAAVKAGRTFATNGPLLELTLQGKGPGEEIRLPQGRGRLEATVRLRSIVPVDHLEIVGRAGVVASLPLTGDHMSADARTSLPVDGSGWYTLRAWAERPQHPVLDIYPFATTSPIYVTVGEQPVRSRADALYFRAWIDRLLAAAQAHDGWNSEAEKEGVLGRLRQARAVFAEQAGTMR
jgi:Tol biopolymer transport system component